MQAIRRIVVALSALVGGVALATAPACQHEYQKYRSSEVAKELDLGSAKVVLEIADKSATRQRGLMFRKSLPPDHGMLFVFPAARVLGFYMRNTAIPLSIAFIEEIADGKQGKIVNIEDMQPFVESPTTVSLRPVRFALEMTQGWFAQHGVKNGDTFELPTWISEIVAGEDQ